MATAVPVSEVKSNARENRTAAHSHIKGLGLKGADGRADVTGGGFVGQAAAREVWLDDGTCRGGRMEQAG